MARALAALLVAVMLVVAPRAARAQPAAPARSAEDAEARKEQARVHFDRGAALVRDAAWEAALAEFLLSRELYPTRGNTQNAAVCLRQLGRYEEALAMLEALLTTFPNLRPQDRAAAEAEITSLRASIGTIEVRASETGAQVQIDERPRGVSPLAAGARVSAGSHRVRAYKQGFAPFEARVEVAGGQSVVVDARLQPLREAGRLVVSEQEGRAADVLVDGIAVGKAPWEGALAPGTHTVSLRGEEGFGTQPAQIVVRADQATPLALALEPLDAELRVEPTPTGALVALDGVALGSGVWAGRVKSGGHRVEVAAPGFLPQSRALILAVGQRERLSIALERDPESPIWGTARGRFVFDAHLGLASGPSLGGDLTGSCSGACSTGVPLGFAGVVHAGYELRMGFALALDAGYLATYESTRGRSVDATPRGRAAISGTADDALALRGLLLGGSLAYHTRGSVPFLFRLGAGALLGEERDARAASFPAGSTNGTETPAARYAYVAPELRVGWRLAEHVELTGGVAVFVLVALNQPRWQDQDALVVGRDFVSFGEQTLAGSLLVVVAPGLGLRYEL